MDSDCRELHHSPAMRSDKILFHNSVPGFYRVSGTRQESAVRKLRIPSWFRGPFLESPGNLSGPISIFFNVFSPITQL